LLIRQLPDRVDIGQAGALWVPGGHEIVKIYFRSNPRWRTAHILDIFKSQ